MIVAHHSYLLRLLQHVVNPLGGAIQYNVRLGRVLYLLQQRSETVGKLFVSTCEGGEGDEGTMTYLC